MRKLSMLLAGLVVFAPIVANSSPITFTLSDPNVDVTFGGVQKSVDLKVVVTADTANFISVLSSGAGSGYANVFVTYTSAALGLVGVTGSELWDFTFHFGGNQDSVILDDAGVFAGEGAIGFGGAITAWDGKSALGPVGPASGSVSNAGLNPTDTIGGVAFVIRNFGSGATFSAVTSIPEPATLALLGAGLFGLWMVRRRPS